MDTVSSFAIVTLAASIHASFQLSVSVLTLMSGHAIGAKTSHTKLLRLTSGFLFGAGVMTMLILSFSSFVLGTFFGTSTPLVVWAIVCGILAGLGLSVWLFYYRQGRGTSLWLPRGMAKYLHDRSKATKQSGEAFGLGLSSVAAELLFVVGPVVVSSLVLIHLSPDLQLLGVLLYTFISLLPLLIVGGLIGSGHKLSGIQKWRESNKRFMQFAAGSGLLILGVFIYVEQVLSATVAAAGGQ
jgi:hypothetical protein